MARRPKRNPLLCNRSRVGRLCCLTAGVLLFGCSSAPKQIVDAQQSFSRGRFDAAARVMTPLSKKRRYRDAADLDLAMIEFATGDFATAEDRLRTSRDRFDDLPQTSIINDAASMATDDTVRQFKPAGYEEVMVRTMLSLCSLAGDRVDAESYALQAMMKQNSLHRESIDQGLFDASTPYQPVAIAPYLRGVLRESTHHDYDDAANAYKLVSSINPTFKPAEDDLHRASAGVHSQPGHGVLYVIACVGRGPQLVETDAPVTTAALRIASLIVNSETNPGSERTVIPNLATVKVPHVMVPPAPIAAIGVGINHTLIGATQTLTNVGQLAMEQNDAEMPWIIARAVARRAFKEAAVAKITDSMGLDGNTGSLFHFATTSAWSASESADTRCWSLLPREFQVFRAELPIGEHDLALQPLGYPGQSIEQATLAAITISDATNTYVFVVAPEAKVYIATKINDKES